MDSFVRFLLAVTLAVLLASAGGPAAGSLPAPAVGGSGGAASSPAATATTATSPAFEGEHPAAAADRDGRLKSVRA